MVGKVSSSIELVLYNKPDCNMGDRYLQTESFALYLPIQSYQRSYPTIYKSRDIKQVIEGLLISLCLLSVISNASRCVEAAEAANERLARVTRARLYLHLNFFFAGRGGGSGRVELD